MLQPLFPLQKLLLLFASKARKDFRKARSFSSAQGPWRHLRPGRRQPQRPQGKAAGREARRADPLRALLDNPRLPEPAGRDNRGKASTRIRPPCGLLYAASLAPFSREQMLNPCCKTHFSSKIFGRFRKRLYLCTRFREASPTVSQEGGRNAKVC